MSWAKAMKPPAVELLAEVIDAYSTVPWEADALKAVLEDIGTRHGQKLGKAQAPVRVAVTGRTVGPPLFESLELLGREATLSRLPRRVRPPRRRVGAAMTPFVNASARVVTATAIGERAA